MSKRPLDNDQALEAGAQKKRIKQYIEQANQIARGAVMYSCDYSKALTLRQEIIKYTEALKTRKYNEILYNSIKDGRFNEVNRLISTGSKVNAIDEHGKTPLDYATEKGHLEVAKSLVENGAHVTPKMFELISTEVLRPHFIAALWCNNIRTGRVEELDVTARTEISLLRQIMIGQLAEEGSMTTLNQLLNVDNPTVKSIIKTKHFEKHARMAILHKYAASIHNSIFYGVSYDKPGLDSLSEEEQDYVVNKVKSLCKDFTIGDSYDNPIKTLESSKDAIPERMREELGKSTDDSIRDEFFSTEEQREVSQRLNLQGRINAMKHATDVDTKDNYWNKPLHYAASLGDLLMVEFLLEPRANVNEQNQDLVKDLLKNCYGEDTTKLLKASKISDYKAAIKAIKDNARIDATIGEDELTPLHYASINGNLAIIESFLKHGAHLNGVNKHGWTPLHYAAKYGKLCSAEFLLNYGADINFQDTFGKTPLHYVVFFKKFDCIKLLIENGATVTQYMIDQATNQNNPFLTHLLTAQWCQNALSNQPSYQDIRAIPVDLIQKVMKGQLKLIGSIEKLQEVKTNENAVMKRIFTEDFVNEVEMAIVKGRKIPELYEAIKSGEYADNITSLSHNAQQIIANQLEDLLHTKPFMDDYQKLKHFADGFGNQIGEFLSSKISTLADQIKENRTVLAQGFQRFLDGKLVLDATKIYDEIDAADAKTGKEAADSFLKTHNANPEKPYEFELSSDLRDPSDYLLNPNLIDKIIERMNNLALSQENYKGRELCKMVKGCSTSTEIESVRNMMTEEATKMSSNNPATKIQKTDSGYDACQTQQAIEAGADVNAKDEKNSTRLKQALINKQTDVVEILLENGAHVDQRMLKVVTSVNTLQPLSAALWCQNARMGQIDKLPSTLGENQIPLLAKIMKGQLVEGGSIETLNQLQQSDNPTIQNIINIDNFVGKTTEEIIEKHAARFYSSILYGKAHDKPGLDTLSLEQQDIVVNKVKLLCGGITIDNENLSKVFEGNSVPDHMKQELQQFFCTNEGGALVSSMEVESEVVDELSGQKANEDPAAGTSSEISNNHGSNVPMDIDFSGQALDIHGDNSL